MDRFAALLAIATILDPTCDELGAFISLPVDNRLEGGIVGWSMAKIKIIRRVRFLTACSATVVVAGGSLIGAIIGGLFALVAVAVGSAPSTVPSWVIPIALFTVFTVIGAVVAASFQAWSEYQRRTYDPAIIFRFDDRFGSQDMRVARANAARILKSNQGKLRDTNPAFAGIDDVLDFFDDLGFYVRGHQLTPEVTHHTFFHWIRGYYVAARDYIEVAQREEPLQWENIRELYETMGEIEAERTGRRETRAPTNSQITTFLDEEIALTEDGC